MSKPKKPKMRSGSAQAALMRTSAGPMRHRLQPRGGARNDQSDLIEDWDFNVDPEFELGW